MINYYYYKTIQNLLRENPRVTIIASNLCGQVSAGFVHLDLDNISHSLLNSLLKLCQV